MSKAVESGKAHYASARDYLQQLADSQLYAVNSIKKEAEELARLEDPTIAQILKARGIASAFAGHVDQAIADLSGALMLKLKDDGYVQAKLGQQMFMRGSKSDLQQALKICQSVVRKGTTSKDARWLAYQVMSATYVRLKQPAKAKGAATKALNIFADGRSKMLLQLADLSGVSAKKRQEQLVKFGALPSDISGLGKSGQSPETIIVACEAQSCSGILI